MTDPKKMPERIWAFEIDCETLEGEYALVNVWNDGVEYIRADLTPTIDVEALALAIRDDVLAEHQKLYAGIVGHGPDFWAARQVLISARRILTEAQGGQNDESCA